jgi:hypothetical protein
MSTQKSTGPRTPEGKAIVALNPLRHGLRARTVVLPGENRQEFHQLCDDLEAEWQPRSRTEQFYLEQMAVSQWKLTRLEVGEIDTFRKEMASGTQIPLLGRLWQAQCRLERSYARAQRELERLQAARRHQVHQRDEPVPAPQPAVKVASAVAGQELSQHSPFSEPEEVSEPVEVLESVKAGRVVDKYLLSHHRVGRPNGKLVQQAPVVNLK